MTPMTPAMPDPARRLTRSQATACENAHSPRCRCRCQGALHGARRATDVAELPPSDPHCTLGQMRLNLTRPATGA
jgi:hypothetical protein